MASNQDDEFERFLPQSKDARTPAKSSDPNNNELAKLLASMENSLSKNFDVLKSQIHDTKEQLNSKLNDLTGRITIVEQTIQADDEGLEDEVTENEEMDASCQEFKDLLNEASGENAQEAVVSDDEADLLDQFVKQAETTEQLDVEVDPRIATITNNTFRKKMDKEVYKKLSNDVQTARPKNCEGLAQVSTNSMLWPSLSEMTKAKDRKLQSLQKSIVKSGAVLSKMFDALIKAKGDVGKLQIPNLLTMVNNALSFMGNANFAVNMFRRDTIKPELKENYKRLCSDNIPFTSELFGDELAKTAKEIGETAKIGNKIKLAGTSTSDSARGRNFRGSYRTTPYGTRYAGAARGGNFNNYNLRQKNFPRGRGIRGKK